MPEIIHLKILIHDELCQRRQMYFIFNKCMYNEVFIALFPIPVYEYILYIYMTLTHMCVKFPFSWRFQSTKIYTHLRKNCISSSWFDCILRIETYIYAINY